MKDPEIRNQAEVFSQLPPEWPHDPMPRIRQLLAESGQKVVILDDDPTGTQTVHDVPVLVDWSPDAIAAEFRDPQSAMFILTNSRSLPAAEARRLNMEIVRSLRQASQLTGRAFAIQSRSDSTLRGHFPGETDALAQALDRSFDLTIVVPAFMAGGRYTIGNVHYVAEHGQLIPASQTPFAQDAVFGYSASDLSAWIEEKTGGRALATDVATISIDDIRKGGPETIRESLKQAAQGSYCVVNAVTDRDLAVVAQACIELEAVGRSIIYRTAASFAGLRAGIEPLPPLSRESLNLPSEGGGLVVVGSYVPKSTQQLEVLLQDSDVIGIEVSVDALLSDALRLAELRRAADSVNQQLRAAKDVVIYTSRQLVSGKDADSNLRIGKQVSEALAGIVRAIEMQPRYIVAKGGITSSDLASTALSVRRALVKGQVLPGVPIWELGEDSRMPDLLYVVFPGNVGDQHALAVLVDKLSERI